MSLSTAIAKAIVVGDRDGSDAVRQNAELGGYCSAKYTPAIKLLTWRVPKHTLMPFRYEVFMMVDRAPKLMEQRHEIMVELV